MSNRHLSMLLPSVTMTFVALLGLVAHNSLSYGGVQVVDDDLARLIRGGVPTPNCQTYKLGFGCTGSGCQATGSFYTCPVACQCNPGDPGYPTCLWKNNKVDSSVTCYTGLGSSCGGAVTSIADCTN